MMNSTLHRRAQPPHVVSRRSRRALFLLSLTAISGCAPAQRERSLVVGWDIQGTNRPYLAAQAQAGVTLIRQLASERDRLTLYRVGTKAEEFFDNAPPASRRNLLKVLKTGLAPESHRGSVRPGHFWSIVADRAAQTSNQTEIVFYTDGDDDERQDRRRAVIAKSVERLATNPRVLRVTICGVLPQNRGHIRETFAKLRSRLQLLGPEELHTLSLVPLSPGGRK